MEKKVLIAYFSHKGMNYSNGDIIELKKGNTEVAAEMAAELTGGRLFEIKSVNPYPYEYRECVAVARDEVVQKIYPEMESNMDISEYDTVILGYPNWCGTMPMVVWTFLKEQDWEGKTVLPYCTNEGSGMGRSEEDLKELLPGVDLRKGLALHGSDVADASAEIEQWLKDNNIL